MSLDKNDIAKSLPTDVRNPWAFSELGPRLRAFTEMIGELFFDDMGEDSYDSFFRKAVDVIGFVYDNLPSG